MNQKFKILAVLLMSFVELACVDSYRDFSQKVKTPDGKHWIALFTDYADIGDPSWHVYKFDINENVENKKIKRHEFNDGALFWNYAEAGNDTQDAAISIVNDRYILFARGSIYHSLYDLEIEKILINDTSPWHSFLESEEYKKMPKNTKLNEQGSFIRKWKLKHLHEPIQRILKEKHNKALKRDG